MKSRIVFSILFVVCIYTKVMATTGLNDSLVCPCCCSGEAFDGNQLPNVGPVDSASLSDSLSYATALINSINNTISAQNNFLTAVGILVTLLALLIAIVGFWGVKSIKEDKEELKNDMNQYKSIVDKEVEDINKELQDKIKEIDGIKESVVERTKEIKEILERQEYQSQYLLRIDRYLFLLTNSVLDNNSGSGKKANAVRKSIYKQYHLVKLFLPWTEGTDGTAADFMFLQAQGTKDDLKDLTFIAENDPDENKKRLARETIGYIKAINDQKGVL